MPSKALQLPLGIRLWPNQLPPHGKGLQEGYTFSLLENSDAAYRFIALAGAGKVQNLFNSFLSCLPQEAFLILEYYPHEAPAETDEQAEPIVYYSPYLPTREILATIEPYLPQLIHDGFVGFGLANNRAGVELFYSEEKVLTCFTGNHIQTMDLLARHGLEYHPELLFPTDFGHDHLSLLCHPTRTLPAPFAAMSAVELDYVHFCRELTEKLEMYPVEENLNFFLSKTEQDHIENRLLAHPDFMEFADEDFGCLLLDWNDFVQECEDSFLGDLWEYRQGLRLRDMIQYVIEGMSPELASKLREIVAEADDRFQKILVDRRKRLDAAAEGGREERFWYRGVVRNQGVHLRRDLIRQGWFGP